MEAPPLCLFNIPVLFLHHSLSNGGGGVGAKKQNTYPSSMRTTSGCFTVDCCWMVAAWTICNPSRTKRHRPATDSLMVGAIFQPVAAQLILLPALARHPLYANRPTAGGRRAHTHADGRSVSKKRKCSALRPTTRRRAQ
jgi:hypothetical protein